MRYWTSPNLRLAILIALLFGIQIDLAYKSYDSALRMCCAQERAEKGQL